MLQDYFKTWNPFITDYGSFLIQTHVSTHSTNSASWQEEQIMTAELILRKQ